MLSLLRLMFTENDPTCKRGVPGAAHSRLGRSSHSGYSEIGNGKICDDKPLCWKAQ